MAVCPLCNGAEKKVVIVRHAQTQQLKTSVEWCICMKSRYVSESPGNEMLKWLGDTYLPLEKIDKELKFYPSNLSVSPNFLIQDTDFETFCLCIKSTIIRYHFRDPIPLIYCCKAIDILKKFYVQQSDGTSPTLSDMNKFDLLIFTLDTKEKNDQLGTCVAQVIYNRDCICKPTWIYLPEGVILQSVREYSDELRTYLESEKYKYIVLTKKNIRIKTIATKAKIKAESFGRKK